MRVTVITLLVLALAGCGGSGGALGPTERERKAAEAATEELERRRPAPLPTASAAPVPVPDVQPSRDPFRYTADRRREFERRAALGNAHVLYALSPDGVLLTAERVNRWRSKVEAAAAAAGVDADRLEALVFLESAGRDQVIAPQGVLGAAGLTQIVAGTGTDLLGMRIDTARSAQLTGRIAVTRKARKRRRLIAARKRADPRFDPTQALAASGRYLALAEDHFSSEELAFVSYHMGIGNLGGVIEAYAGGPTQKALRYAQLYFDSSPTRNAGAWQRLFDLGDDSSNYLWKLLAAEDIMAAWRDDPDALTASADQHLRKNSAEEVLHPETETAAFVAPDDVAEAYDSGVLLRLPADPQRFGIRYDDKMGRQARRLDQSKALYRGLRPEALAVLIHIGQRVRTGSGSPGTTLEVTSTVRDQRYQAALLKRNVQATPNFSLHTTGYAFDIRREYSGDRQARAFQAILDRLLSLNLIAYVYEPGAIHVTVSAEGEAYSPLLVQPEP